MALIREATKRPKITLKELQSSTAEIGVSVHRTTLSCTPHRAALYRRVTRKKPLLKEKNKQTHLVFAKRHVGDSPNIRRRYSGQMTKYREIVEGNLFQSSRHLRLGRRFTFQQENDPKHTAKATLKGKH